MRTFEKSDLDYLFDKISLKYKIDLFNYAQASLERRIERFLTLHYFENITDLADKLFNDSLFFELFITEITVNTTEMFRDPECWKIIREDILPILNELPGIRIWHAGCSSGEEIFTMAILLKELGLSEKSKLIASDINKEIIEKAKRGVYSNKTLDLNTENYLKSGGKNNFSNYYNLEGNNYKMDSSLLNNVTFMRHDLSSGQAFSKFDLIICRNVLIYFNKDLQEKVFSLFQNSLFKKSFISIGKKESMTYYSNYHQFAAFSESEKIYRLK